MGLKLFIIGILALIMTIPALFVGNLVQERTNRSREVVREVSTTVGGEQTFLGPTLAVPYTISSTIPGNPATQGLYLVFPSEADAVVKTSTKERRRSLFNVSVFRADLVLNAAFDLIDVPSAVPPGAVLDWSRAEIVVGVTDPRGALSDGTLSVNGHTATFAPAQNIERIHLGSDPNKQLGLSLFGVNAAPFARPNAKFNLTSSLRFSGAQRIAILAYGKTTKLTMDGDWSNPSFDGGFLPAKRTISARGFQGEWSIPFIA